VGGAVTAAKARPVGGVFWTLFGICVLVGGESIFYFFDNRLGPALSTGLFFVCLALNLGLIANTLWGLQLVQRLSPDTPQEERQTAIRVISRRMWIALLVAFPATIGLMSVAQKVVNKGSDFLERPEFRILWHENDANDNVIRISFSECSKNQNGIVDLSLILHSEGTRRNTVPHQWTTMTCVGIVLIQEDYLANRTRIPCTLLSPSTFTSTSATEYPVSARVKPCTSAWLNYLELTYTWTPGLPTHTQKLLIPIPSP